MTFALPSEPAPLIALALGLIALAVPSARGVLTRGSLDVFVIVCSALAAALSAIYVVLYLRGGPRIIDATSYYLEARALSEGHFAWQAPEPSASFAGRFLVRDSLAGGEQLSVIFPPGYPALLALGFLVGAPMLMGPVLAFAVTYFTAFLARVALPITGSVADHALGVRLCVVLSVACAALRYHTADTMSHGLAAVCVAAGLGCALHLSKGGGLRFALGMGVAIGWLVATRPVSGLAAFAVVAWVVGRKARLPAVALAALGAAPFLLLLAWHQRAATGQWLSSAQSLYYATSDGPAGCFRYGFGTDIGCRFEHGDFVRHNLMHGDHHNLQGYGPFDALKTTLRRLKMHGVDALNSEPLAVLVLVPAFFFALRRVAARPLALMIIALIAVYVPFYFDGNFPGGGGRFFADVLPVEHVLIAGFLIHELAPRLARVKRLAPLGVSGLAGGLIGLALLGFAFRAHTDHASLRDREGGRPMFMPAELAARGVDGGLVFVDTDHGFALGADPVARAGPGVPEIVRHRGDALDWFVWNDRGRPSSYRHRYDLLSGETSIEPFVPPLSNRVEGENLWPPLAQQGGYAIMEHTTEPCASSGRWLRIQHTAREVSVRLELPRALLGSRVVPVLAMRSHVASVQLLVDGKEAPRARSSEPPLSDAPPLGSAPCYDAGAWDLPAEGHRVQIVIASDLRVRTSTSPSVPPADAWLLALDVLRVDAAPESR